MSVSGPGRDQGSRVTRGHYGVRLPAAEAAGRSRVTSPWDGRLTRMAEAARENADVPRPAPPRWLGAEAVEAVRARPGTRLQPPPLSARSGTRLPQPPSARPGARSP